MKTVFCLSHFIMGTAVLFLTLSKNMAAYYVANVLYGFQRSALLSIPFIIAENYIQEQVSEHSSSSFRSTSHSQSRG